MGGFKSGESREKDPSFTTVFGIKKKIEDEIKDYFPEKVNESRISMHYNFLNKHGILTNRKILGEDVDDELARVENEFYIRSKPVLYGGPKGLLMKVEKAFETNCLILQQNGVVNPEKIPVLKFYQSIELINKQRSSHGEQKRNTKRK